MRVVDAGARGTGDAGSPGGANPTAPMASAQLATLRGVLPVLARPATASDRNGALLALLSSIDPQPFAGALDPALAHRAARTPWGAVVYLVAVDAARRPRVLCDHPGGVCKIAVPPGLFFERPDGWGVGVLLAGSAAQTAGRSFGCCAPATAIQRGRAAWALRVQGGERLLALAPAGAARAVFELAGARSVSAAVHGDVATASYPRALALRGVEFYDGGGQRIVYHG